MIAAIYDSLTGSLTYGAPCTLQMMFDFYLLTCDIYVKFCRILQVFGGGGVMVKFFLNTVLFLLMHIFIDYLTI